MGAVGAVRTSIANRPRYTAAIAILVLLVIAGLAGASVGLYFALRPAGAALAAMYAYKLVSPPDPIAGLDGAILMPMIEAATTATARVVWWAYEEAGPPRVSIGLVPTPTGAWSLVQFETGACHVWATGATGATDPPAPGVWKFGETALPFKLEKGASVASASKPRPVGACLLRVSPAPAPNVYPLELEVASAAPHVPQLSGATSTNPSDWDRRLKSFSSNVGLIERATLMNKVAVIIEPRLSEILMDLLRWMVYLLAPVGWKFIVYVGFHNRKQVHELVETLDVADVLEVRDLHTDNLSIHDYNVMLTSKSFWEEMPFENILIFQTDTLLLDSSLDAFLKYDYVGAPWNKSRCGWLNASEHTTGNGGLSLRTKSGMLRALETLPYNGMNEDTFFCLACKSTLNIAPYDTAMQFSVETLFYATPKGFHKCWSYLSFEEMQRVYAYIDSVLSKTKSSPIAHSQTKNGNRPSARSLACP